MSVASAEAPVPANFAKDTAITRTMDAFLRDHKGADNTLQPAFGIPCTGGTVVDASGTYPCNNIDLASFTPLANLGGGEANDIWGWTSGSREFAIMGRTSGTAFVEITNPMAPIYLGNLATQTANSNWRDIKVYNDHAFIVSEAGAHGMQVFDLTQLLTAAPGSTFANTAFYNGFGSCHNIVINEDSGFAYGVGCAAGTQSNCSGGLHAVDINAPTAPAFAGCFSSDGYTHDAECVRYNGPDLTYIGREICVNSNEDTVTIVDVTNKAAPVQLSRTGYTGAAYTHQNWFTEDQRTVLMDDELDEQGQGHNTRTRIFNVSDLDAPTLIGFQDSTESSIDHNLYIKGHSAYLSNYQAGLRVYDTTNAAGGTLPEIGFFDVYTQGTTPNFNGTWSNFMYYDSDVIAVSHIENGLYILDPNQELRDSAQDFVMDPTEVVLDVCDSASTTFELDSVFGFNANVAMSISGAVDNDGAQAPFPAGLTAAFSANPVAVQADNGPGTPMGETTTLTITDVGATPGNYLILVTATGGGITHQEYLRVEVCAAPQLAIGKSVSPAGAVMVGDTVEYEITVPNTGGGVASTTVTDAIPADLSNVSCNIVEIVNTPEEQIGTVTFDCATGDVVPSDASGASGGRPGTLICAGTYSGIDGSITNVDLNGLTWTTVGASWSSELEAFVDCPAGGMADYQANPWGAPTGTNGNLPFTTGPVPNNGCAGQSPLGAWQIAFNDSFGDNPPTADQVLDLPVTLEVYGTSTMEVLTPVTVVGNQLTDTQDIVGGESVTYVCTGVVADTICSENATETLTNTATATSPDATNSPVDSNTVSTTVDIDNSMMCSPLAVEMSETATSSAVNFTAIALAVGVVLALMATASLQKANRRVD